MKLKPLIFLSKEIVTSNLLTSEGMLAYVAIRCVCQKDIPLHINADFLCSLFTSGKDYVENRKLKDKMNRGIQELIDNNMIIPLYRLSKTSLVVNCDKLYVDTEHGELFVKIFMSDVKTLMQLSNIQHDKILSYFIQLSATINRDSHIGFTGFDTLADRTRIARQTSYRFNQLLEEENIVCFNYNKTPVKYCISKEVKGIKNFNF
jgi:hypothetical protein